MTDSVRELSDATSYLRKWRAKARCRAERAAARRAFARGDFASAYQGYVVLWKKRHSRDDLVWAGWSLERAQLWRGDIAVWEEVARNISKQLGDTDKATLNGPRSPARSRAPHPVEGSDLFAKLQLAPRLWDDPRSDNEASGYYQTLGGVLRHQRAWALHWASEHATAADRHELAARLHRAAAFAWAASNWGDEEGRQKATYGDKWEQAANAFFYSYMEAIEARLRDRKDMLAEQYELNECTELRGFTGDFSDVPHEPKGLLGKDTDVDRIVMCLEQWAKHREGETSTIKDDSDHFRALTKACEALDAIERELARAGRRADAVRVHRKRHHLLRKRDRRNLLTFTRRWGERLLFGCGARPVVPLFWAAFSWLIFFPGVFWYWHLVYHATTRATWYQTWLFSISNALTISVDNLRTISAGGALAQVLGALTAYVFFGAVLFSLFRSFDS